MTIQHQRPPDGVGVVRQPALPEGVRHDRRVARLADALGGEHASLRRLDAQRREVVRAHRLAVYPQRFVAGVPGELLDPIAEARHARRRLAQVAQIQPGDPIAVADPEADQRCRPGGAHWLQDDRVHDAEECRAEAGADAQRQAGDDEQRLAADQPAAGVAQILDRPLESGRNPDVVRRLARQRRVPHAEAGGTPCVLGRQAGVELVLLGKGAMPGDLVSEVLLAPPAMPQIREPSKQPHRSVLSVRLVACNSHFGSGSRARRPAGQARGARKSGICQRRATPPGGMPRPRGTVEMTDTGH